MLKKKKHNEELIKEEMVQLAKMKVDMKILKEDIDSLQAKILSYKNVPEIYETNYGTLMYIEPTNYEIPDNNKLLESGFSLNKFIDNAKITPKRVKEIVSEDFYKKIQFLGVIKEKKSKPYFKLNQK